MIKAVIIDDEKQSRESLKDDLGRYCPQVEIAGEAEGVKSGIKLITEVQPKLVFLDIELTDGTGFDLLERLSSEQDESRAFHFSIIFTTSFNQYAVKAFRFSALDYLLKPIDPDELAGAVKKFTDTSGKNQELELNLLFENLKKNNRKPKIALSTSDSILVYKVEDIVRCESQRNYTMFYFKNDKPLLISKTLKEYDDLLKDNGFERIHNSHLVNLNYVKKYVKSDGGYLIMEDGSSVPVAQSKKEHLMKILSSGS